MPRSNRPVKPRAAEPSPASAPTPWPLAAALFILVLALAARVPVDTDTWWHLRSGEHMLATGAILRTDPFSFTALGQPWIDHSWGTQLVMALVHRAGRALIGGPEGGSIALALVTGAVAAAGMVLTFRITTGHPLVRFAVTALAAAAALIFWTARPQMVSFVLCAVILVLLHLLKRRRIDRLWVIPPLMVVWVNLHAGYFIGFLLIAGFVAGETLGRWLDRDDPDRVPTRKLLALVGIAALGYLALAINPNGIQMWPYAFRTFEIGVIQSLIQEWASPNFHNRWFWPFAALLLLTFVALGRSGKRASVTDLTLLIGTGFMALYSARNIPVFALVAAPLLADHASAALARVRGDRDPVAPRLPQAWAIALLSGSVVLAGWMLTRTLRPRAVAEVQAAVLPVRATEFLAAAKLEGQMFNAYDFGGYLIYALPQHRVFVDGRTDLYRFEVLDDWVEAATGRRWRETFEKWRIGFAIIQPNLGLADRLRGEPGWKQVYADDRSLIFTRTGALPAGGPGGS
jgi:hypothetical protein